MKMQLSRTSRKGLSSDWEAEEKELEGPSAVAEEGHPMVLMGVRLRSLGILTVGQMASEWSRSHYRPVWQPST